MKQYEHRSLEKSEQSCLGLYNGTGCQHRTIREHRKVNQNYPFCFQQSPESSVKRHFMCGWTSHHVFLSPGLVQTNLRMQQPQLFDKTRHPRRRVIDSRTTWLYRQLLIAFRSPPAVVNMIHKQLVCPFRCRGTNCLTCLPTYTG